MTKSIEVYRGALLSLLRSLLVGALVFYMLLKYLNFDQISTAEALGIFRSMGSTLSQISITLAGFILTSTAIFTAFGDKPLIQNMYLSGHANTLITRMYLAIFLAVATSVFSLYLVISPNLNERHFFLALSLAGSTFYLLASVMIKLWFVLHYVASESDSSEYEDVNQTPKEITNKNL